MDAQFEQRLRTLAGRLELAEPRNREEQAIVGHLLGAIWALLEAHRHRVRDRSGKALPRDYSTELRRVARAISKDRDVSRIRWSGEFHFNSALYRLGSLSERLAKYTNQDRRLAKDVSGEVQRLKHDVVGLLAPRTVDFRRAADAASKLVEVFERAAARSRVGDA